MPKLVNLKLDEITVGEGVRKTIDEESIEELSASFERHGVLQSVLVQSREGRYELLIGARRLLVARRAGLETIPALVLDEAEAYLALKEMGYPLAAIGRRLGKSQPYVSTRVRLLKLHPALREASCYSGSFSLIRACAWSGVIVRCLTALAQEVQAEGLSVHETRQRVRERLGKELKWRLVPVRLSLDIYEVLQRIAPEGDVKRLIQETVEKLVQT